MPTSSRLHVDSAAECMSLYLSRCSGLRASTGTYAARRQPSVMGGDFFLLRVSGLSHHAWPSPTFSRLHIDSTAARVCICICRGGVGRMCARGRMRVFLVQLCILCSREWLVVPRVTHARLLPPLYRQRSSVCIHLYLRLWSGACGSTGAHAARR